MSDRVEASQDELIATYHRHAREKRPDDFWAWDRVGDIVRGDDAERAFELVVALVRSAPDDRLGYVGAGPVEDLVETHGARLLDWLVGEASRDARFREALGSIWLVAEEIPAEVLAGLQDATGHQILVTTRSALSAAESEWLKQHQADHPGEA